MRTSKVGTATRIHRSAVPEASWQEWISEAGATREVTAVDQVAATHPGRVMHGDSRLSHEDIARAAYAHWQARGCPHGSAEEDWFAAERLLLEQTRQ